MAHKLALEARIGCRLLLKHPAIVWLVRHVAWLMTKFNTGRDAMVARLSRRSSASHVMAASASLVNRCITSLVVVLRAELKHVGGWEPGLARWS